MAATPTVNLPFGWRRIVEECFEVAFILCNNELEEFSVSKIFDVFLQDLPTALILRTGYWPLYSTPTNQCVCVCGRFGLQCRHMRSEFHWIDMRPIENPTDAALFYPKLYGNVYPEQYHILINQIEGEICSYNLSARMKVTYKKLERGRSTHRRSYAEMTSPALQKTHWYLNIYAKFTLYREYYTPLHSIQFQPNPFYHPQYGSLFKDLLYLRSLELPFNYNLHYNVWFVSSHQVPAITLVFQNGNLPVYRQPMQLICIYPPPEFVVPKYQKRKRNKETQTYDNVEPADVKIKYELKEIPNVWPSTSTSTSNSDLVDPLTQSLREFASIASDLSGFNLTEEEPILIEDSEEYDVQFPREGYKKVITPSQGDSPTQTQMTNDTGLWEEATNDFYSTVVKSEPEETPQVGKTGKHKRGKRKRKSTATITSSQKVTPSMVEELTWSLQETPGPSTSAQYGSEFPFLVPAVPQSRKQKEKWVPGSEGPIVDIKKELEYIEKNFPALRPKPARRMTKEEIDEELDLIQEVINDDLQRMGISVDENTDWWNIPEQK